ASQDQGIPGRGRRMDRTVPARRLDGRVAGSIVLRLAPRADPRDLGAVAHCRMSQAPRATHLAAVSPPSAQPVARAALVRAALLAAWALAANAWADPTLIERSVTTAELFCAENATKLAHTLPIDRVVKFRVRLPDRTD